MVAHLQHLQQPLSQTNSPIRRTSGDSGYFALTPDRATTPASSTSSSTSSIYTVTIKCTNLAPTLLCSPGAQVYPNPFMAEHMAARLQQQQQKQQQQMCLQHISMPSNPAANANANVNVATITTTTTSNAGNTPVSAAVPPASLQQALHRLNIANPSMTAPSMSSLYRTSSLSTLAPVSRKSLSTQSHQHQHVASPLSPTSSTTSPTSTTTPSVASPGNNNGSAGFTSRSHSLVESPTGCCAPMAAENQSERPGASGERAGIASPANTPSAHANTLDVSSSISISPPSSMITNQSDNPRRHSSNSNMSLHGHSPLGRMEISTSDNDDSDNDNSKMHHDGCDDNDKSSRPISSSSTLSSVSISSSSSSSMLQPPMQMSSSTFTQSATTALNHHHHHHNNTTSNSNVMIDANQFNGWNLLVQNSTLSKDSTTRDMAGTIPHATMVTGTLLSDPSTNNRFTVNPAPPVVATSNMNGYYH
ncbi:hypothetical protein BDF22DRAFT_673877 [Syncephalis plumigaleata]|nr:hypothetical protein BDF22DRAFT_673877 [Syncephalis plumigaleata]